MKNRPGNVNTTARTLGYAGLLPPAAMLGAVAYDPTLNWLAAVAGFGYAAFVFSFLGGVWWGLAISRQSVAAWLWFAGIAPSLLSLALFLPWSFGWEWPGPEMVILSGLILLSPLVDLGLAKSAPLPSGWLRLRLHLSLGLSLFTVILSRF